VKGVEEQTERLMEVCRMRDTPVIVFINKMDRPGQDPFDLLDELEAKLNIRVRPLSWPIGIGSDFKGVYELQEKQLKLFDADIQKVAKDVVHIKDLSDPRLDQELGKQAIKLREEVELVEGVYDAFDEKAYHEGQLAPVFFGSALYNFGVQELLEKFISIAPMPRPRPTDQGFVVPTKDEFSGFIFKIHANLDPRHRDRIAFLRVCSGKFERNTFYHHVRLNKKVRFSSPASFLAQRKSIVDEAYPGDVIGLYDTGNFKIGDTLTEGSSFNFRGIPTFSPEIFKELINDDPMKSKQLEKGVTQLTDEGVAQLFTQEPGARRIIGTVGELQFEVIQYRLQHEYGAACHFDSLPYYKALWITSDNKEVLDKFVRLKPKYICQDKDHNLVFLAGSEWTLNMERQNYPEIVFHTNSEFKTETAV
jgi:peptide chain release factor 3